MDAFKIEGRMKSVYYTANVTRIYRHALDTIAARRSLRGAPPLLAEELDLVSHRPYTDDLFNEFGNRGFVGVPYIKKPLHWVTRRPRRGPIGPGVRAFNPIRAGEEHRGHLPH